MTRDGLWQPVDPTPCLDILEGRFGIPRPLLDDFLVVRQSSKVLALVRRGTEPPERPRPAAVGMPFFYDRMRHPRPTTAAVVRFGAAATRNVAEITEAQVVPFVRRQEVELTPEQARHCTGDGYAIARHLGLTVGLGLYRRDARRHLLRGSVPSHWARELGI